MRGLLAIAVLGLDGWLPAQVFVVDASNGPGTHFLDLPPAVAAVPDGAMLRVRAGEYTPFARTGRGLRVIGEGLARLTLSAGDVDLRGTAAGQVIVLRGR